MRSVRRIAGCVTTGAGYAPAGRNAELQPVGPGGGLLWDWRSQDHISPAETGHRGHRLEARRHHHAGRSQGQGRSSFLPLGGQHDARLLGDGTLTLFNNRTFLGNHRPRVERFRINQTNGTARLLQSITDPGVDASGCCGSARRLPNRDWLIDWGGYENNPIGSYTPGGGESSC